MKQAAPGTTCAIKECNRPAEKELVISTHHLPVSLELCQPHTYDMTINQKRRVGKFAAHLEKEGIFEKGGHSEGWTYVIRMSTGHIKIGYTNGKQGPRRFQDLSREQGGIPVQVLAVMQGGESLEALKHHEWAHLRVSGAMEIFHPDPSLLQWAEGQGIHPDAKEVLEAFTDWQAGRHKSKQYNNAAKWAGLLNVAPKLTGELDKDPRADWGNEVKTEEDWKF
ncbi:GIY-YIG nuclease family protein [Streptomyces bacillaris]|uniref:GIY-YIG nuclease family protein n=1 Tax=Streptomyces bacillaris TaxID=68179 RepID=UPI0037FCCD40